MAQKFDNGTVSALKCVYVCVCVWVFFLSSFKRQAVNPGSLCSGNGDQREGKKQACNATCFVLPFACPVLHSHQHTLTHIEGALFYDVRNFTL